MVKRYELSSYAPYIEADEIGDYVLHTDYALLESENARLKDTLDKMHDLYTCVPGNAHGCDGHKITGIVNKALGIKP